MKLAPQPVRHNLRPRPAPLDFCAVCPGTPISRLAPGLATEPRQLFSVPLPGRSLFTLFTIQNSSDLSPARQNATPVSPFRMNTCKSVSKQRTLTTFRINTYEKRGEGGGGNNWNISDTLGVAITCATWRLYLLWSQSIAHTSCHHRGVPNPLPLFTSRPSAACAGRTSGRTGRLNTASTGSL